jgi:hypothetical protein
VEGENEIGKERTEEHPEISREARDLARTRNDEGEDGPEVPLSVYFQLTPATDTMEIWEPTGAVLRGR